MITEYMKFCFIYKNIIKDFFCKNNGFYSRLLLTFFDICVIIEKERAGEAMVGYVFAG